MTATLSLSRRLVLHSTRRHSARSLAKPKVGLRRLQASLAGVQPSFGNPSPLSETSSPQANQRSSSVSVGTPAYRVPERRRRRWVAPSEETPISKYEEMVKNGILRPDEHQKTIIEKLQRLHDDLRDYEQPPVAEIVRPTPTFFQRMFGGSNEVLPEAPSDLPRGLYLYGDVGTGKTMLMDLFYLTLPPNIKRKERVHFHAFMIDVHKRLHAYKLAHPHDGADPVLPIARDLAKEYSVVCFDEFQVTDIAVAMILRRLLECMLRFGVVFVMTSNRHPTELYKRGIQRTSFVPAIELIMKEFDVTDLDSGTDYRKIPRALSNVYFQPLTKENRAEILKLFDALTANDGPRVEEKKLVIWGRNVKIPESSDNVAKFSFQELCGQPMSAADYLEITRRFPTVFVLDVPKMNLNHKDMARRFITFIDACYENHTKLFVSSEVPIYRIFSDDSEGQQAKEKTDHIRSIMDDLGISDQQVGTTSIFDGEEELFAFARACSRLIQMGTQEWALTAGQDNRHAVTL
ncbi:hypothetical protein CPB86DRAFT_779227 [Serendipita vermifera]|nr:hypothetical protein CPB86DRAFT_779227 [Serendipita vermifera]